MMDMNVSKERASLRQAEMDLSEGMVLPSVPERMAALHARYFAGDRDERDALALAALTRLAIGRSR